VDKRHSIKEEQHLFKKKLGNLRSRKSRKNFKLVVIMNSSNIKEKSMIVCWFCGEDIEEGLKVCPICKGVLEDEQDEKERLELEKKERMKQQREEHEKQREEQDRKVLEKQEEVQKAGKTGKTTLLKNEIKLDALTNQDQLTNLRITQEYSDFFGAAYKNSIFLEKISSVEVHFKSKPIYLVLGVIIFILGIWAKSEFREDSAFTFGLIVSVVFIVAFFLTRKHVISVTPDGGKSIDITVKGVGETRIEEYITNIQEAKLARVANIG